MKEHMNPWENEPNFKIFKYKESICTIHRKNGLGHLCGYAMLTPRQVKRYREIEDNLDIHGGITFEEELGEHNNIWNFSYKDFWGQLDFSQDNYELIVGFDCAHIDDIVPNAAEIEANAQLMIDNKLEGWETVKALKELTKKFEDMGIINNKRNKTYKTFDFVETELKSLVDQLE